MRIILQYFYIVERNVHQIFPFKVAFSIFLCLFVCWLDFMPVGMPRTWEQHYSSRLINYSYSKKIMRCCMRNILCSLNQWNVHWISLWSLPLAFQPSKLKFLLSRHLATNSLGLGRLFANQVASLKILGAMRTKMVATWRVAFSCFSL